MIERIEQYRQVNGVFILKVYCKPTKRFPNGGYFYSPAEAVDLVKNYTWFLHQHRNRIEVIAIIGNNYVQKTIYFHKELFKFYQGYNWNGDIDHLSLVELDNTDNNLNAVTHQQNKYNTFTKGYGYSKDWGTFQPKVVINSKLYRPYSVTHREDEACMKQNYLEQEWLRNKLGTDYYMFDFLKYRRGSEDLLDLERIGKISEEEATYRHILRYKDNAWYYMRFGLEEYFKQYHIPVPKYTLDTNGFMVHPVTNQRLYPF